MNEGQEYQWVEGREEEDGDMDDGVAAKAEDGDTSWNRDGRGRRLAGAIGSIGTSAAATQSSTSTFTGRLQDVTVFGRALGPGELRFMAKAFWPSPHLLCRVASSKISSYLTDGAASTGGDAVHAAWDNDLETAYTGTTFTQVIFSKPLRVVGFAFKSAPGHQ